MTDTSPGARPRGRDRSTAPAGAALPEPPKPTGRALMIVGFALSSLVQLGLVALVVAYFLDESDEALDGILLLSNWCLIGTGYVIVTVIVLGVLVRRPSSGQGRPSRIEISRPARLISLVATILTSLIGVAAAIQLAVLKTDTSVGAFADFVGVWAMILSWGLLHWGFAQLYYQDYYTAEKPPMRFPDTEFPRLTDFVYFSFTLGTSFAASDVEVRSSRTRWRVTWHSVLSFFFNGLIIVFALNSILSAAQG